MKTTTLVPRYGSNRLHAELPGKLLGPCKWIGCPFAGGMCELPYFQAPAILVSDADRCVINLAECVRDESLRLELVEELQNAAFHPECLQKAQKSCAWWANKQNYPYEDPCIIWAASYFISTWMARNDSAGTDKELDASLSVRWNGNGGDSNKRFRSATEALEEWGQVMRSCSFVCMDAFEFLANVKDRPDDRLGLYCDPPWPGDGASYKHKFTDDQQKKLADTLAGFDHVRIVCRFGDHPLIRSLYPDHLWNWLPVTSRTQANKAKSEVLLTNFSCEFPGRAG